MIFTSQRVKAGQLFSVLVDAEHLVSGLCGQQGSSWHGAVLKTVLIILRQRII